MDLGLGGRRVLVTGGTAGLGQAVAAGFRAEGAAVAIGGRDAGRAAEVADQLGAVAVVGDLTAAGEPERVVEAASAALAGLDVVVVNTGGGRPGGVLDVTPDDEEHAYATMLRPALRAARASVPHLRRSDQARLLFLTARSVVEASPELALSGVFRSGVAAAGRSLAIELAPDVLVNVVVPGQFPTGGLDRFEASLAARERVQPADVRRRHEEAIPLRRLGRPDELADVVVFLASRAASYITGTVVRVDGGAVRGY